MDSIQPSELPNRNVRHLSRCGIYREHMTRSSTDTVSIALSAPEIQGNEWKYVKDCLDTGWVSSVGEYVPRFEQMIAQTVGAPFSACN